METQIENMSEKILERAQLKQLISACMSGNIQCPLVIAEDATSSNNALKLIEFVAGQIGSQPYYAAFDKIPSAETVTSLPHDTLVLQGCGFVESLTQLVQLCDKCSQHIIYIVSCGQPGVVVSMARVWRSKLLPVYYCWNRNSMLSMARDLELADEVLEYICHDDFALRPKGVGRPKTDWINLVGEYFWRQASAFFAKHDLCRVNPKAVYALYEPHCGFTTDQFGDPCLAENPLLEQIIYRFYEHQGLSFREVNVRRPKNMSPAELMKDWQIYTDIERPFSLWDWEL